VGSFLKITEVAQIFGLPFSTAKKVFILKNNGLGNILGDFFAKSSGHPASTWTPGVRLEAMRLADIPKSSEGSV
jgi:hypothetical protein